MLTRQDRLSALLQTNQLLTGDLTAPVLLQRIVEAAGELIGAHYAALGVLDLDGAYFNFVHTGLPDTADGRVGLDLTEGDDRLGTSQDEARPFRACTGADHDQPCPLPEGHQPINTMLSVPITLSEEHLGNLYISRTATAPFTAEEEELATALAVIAAVAIKKSSRNRTAMSQAEWMRASAMVTSGSVSAPGVHPLRLILDQAAAAAGADLVAVLVPNPARDNLEVELALGAGAEWIQGLRIPIDGTASGAAFRSGEPINSEELASFEPILAARAHVGPTMIAPMRGSTQMLGLLLLARTTAARPFSATDLQMAHSFAIQAAVCVELATARAEENSHRRADRAPQEQSPPDAPALQVLTELLSAGQELHSLRGLLAPGRLSTHLDAAISRIDEAIVTTRSMPAGFVLDRAPELDRPGLEDQLGEVIAGMRPLLGFTPGLRIDIPASLQLPADLLGDLLAALHEALSNIGEHAVAESALVLVRALEGRLTLEVRDDGIGIVPGSRRLGLVDLHLRAAARGGILTVRPRQLRGTVLTWSVPWTGAGAPRVPEQARRCTEPWAAPDPTDPRAGGSHHSHARSHGRKRFWGGWSSK